MEFINIHEAKTHETIVICKNGVPVGQLTECKGIKSRKIGLLKGKLPNLHKDPFDRLLISQVKADNIKFLTADEKLKR